jgi:hypothetical protein
VAAGSRRGQLDHVVGRAQRSPTASSCALGLALKEALEASDGTVTMEQR